VAVTFTFRPPAVNAIAAVAAAAKLGERAGAEVLLQKSQPLVPVEHGDLKASGRVEQGDDGAAVIYGVASPDGYPYGIRQHEDTSLNHPNGGQAKFLEGPMHTEHAAVGAAALAPIAAVLR
jgi:hypothetical protein